MTILKHNFNNCQIFNKQKILKACKLVVGKLKEKCNFDNCQKTFNEEF